MSLRLTNDENMTKCKMFFLGLENSTDSSNKNLKKHSMNHRKRVKVMHVYYLVFTLQILQECSVIFNLTSLFLSIYYFFSVFLQICKECKKENEIAKKNCVGCSQAFPKKGKTLQDYVPAGKTNLTVQKDIICGRLCTSVLHYRFIIMRTFTLILTTNTQGRFRR